MNSFANENEITGKRVPHLVITRQIPPASPASKPARIEVAWQTAPEQSVPIGAAPSVSVPPELPLLPAPPAHPGPLDCCYL